MAVETFGFEAAEWEAIKLGPIHMLRCVAGADSHIDRAEWSALFGAVLASIDHEDELVRSLMEDLSDELEANTGLAPDATSDALEALRGIAGLLESRPDRGVRLRETLLEFGATIAESSGAQLTRTFSAHHSPGWARAAGTSATEREALRAAAEALGIG